MDAPDFEDLLDAIEAGGLSATTWRALMDALAEDEAKEDERAWELIRRHMRAIPGADLAYGLARIVAERSMDAASATYALTTFLRRGDAPGHSIDGALWLLTWLTACERSDTGAIEDVVGAVTDVERAEHFAALNRGLDTAMAASSLGARLQGEARERLRAIGGAPLLAEAARHLSNSQQSDVAAALRRAGAT